MVHAKIASVLALAIAGGTLAFLAAPQAYAGKDRDDRSALMRTAEQAAGAARKAMAAHKAVRAVQMAERAVAAMPQSGDYRALLGEAYLAAGRFSSAGVAFSDALSLKPEDDGVAFKLALIRIAEGQPAVARDLIDVRRSALAPHDYALARALAGDPAGAAEILEAVLRAGEGNAKTRQNLAFTYALAGRWPEARTMAGFDLPPEAVSDRIGQWAELTRAGAEKERIASLLGVTPVEDIGQPEALALRPTVPAVPSASPIPAALAEAQGPTETAPAPEPSPQLAVYEVDPAIKDPAPVRLEPVAPMKRPPLLLPRAPVKEPAMTARLSRQWQASLRPGTSYVVQLGAFKTADGAARAWRKMTARHGALRRLDGRQAEVKLASGKFYRLSVGFPSRNTARTLCQSVRAAGNSCFVRTMAAGDTVRWAAPMLRRSTQLAMR